LRLRWLLAALLRQQSLLLQHVLLEGIHADDLVFLFLGQLRGQIRKVEQNKITVVFPMRKGGNLALGRATQVLAVFLVFFRGHIQLLALDEKKRRTKI